MFIKGQFKRYSTVLRFSTEYLFKSGSRLTLIQAAGGVYDFQNFEQVQLHNALSNKIF
jgi:hypothetical protein